MVKPWPWITTWWWNQHTVDRLLGVGASALRPWGGVMHLEAVAGDAA